MTVNFRHGSSKFRHKMTSMTKFENVMYWASRIPSRDVLKFLSWINMIHDVLKPSYIGVKPIEPSPKPKICDESDRHGLTCHITHRWHGQCVGRRRGSHVANDVAATWQTTWQPHGRRHDSHVADDVVQNQMAKFNTDHNSTNHTKIQQ
jgi:hypothetical protein